MKRISRNLTAAALTGALALAGVTAANAEESNTQTGSSITSNEGKGDQGSSNEGDQGSSDKGDKDGSSADLKGKLSSEDGKPTDLGIAVIVLGVVGALAAAAPAAAQALGVNLPF